MKKLKAYTLLEVLISSLVLGFLGVGSMFMVSNSNRVLNAGVKMSMVNSNAQTIMREISNDIKAGMRLDGGGSSLVISYDDGTKAKWYVAKEKLFRTDRNGKTKEVLLVGAKDIRVTATFTPDSSLAYWKTDVELSMTLDDGNTFGVKNVTNTYYCRLQEDGFVN